jgi:CheY-like chemotaxis protein
LNRGASFANEARRILVADDNRDWADALAVLLKDQGYIVRTAGNGREAVEAAREFRPHVVILDICMPAMTGYESARALHAHPSDPRPVMVAVTAWPREAGKLDAELAGFDHYLGKSAQSASILALLKKIEAGG